MGFVKATKRAAKLRLAIFGPSGAGKTFTALRIARGLGGRVAVIDSERGSASKYSDRFDFDVCDLDDKSIAAYQQAIRDAAAEGYAVLVIDSLSHAWQELLEEIDRLAAGKFRGNTWSAWSEGTPKQRALVDAILSYPGHVIATMRSKTEWATETNSKGKQEPKRVGLAPEQGKGIEYEFDLLLEMNIDHFGRFTKDRTGKFQDEILEKPGEEFGRDLAAWLADGAPAPTAPPPTGSTFASIPKSIPGATMTRERPAPTGQGGTVTSLPSRPERRPSPPHMDEIRKRRTAAGWTDEHMRLLFQFYGWTGSHLPEVGDLATLLPIIDAGPDAWLEANTPPEDRAPSPAQA